MVTHTTLGQRITDAPLTDNKGGWSDEDHERARALWENTPGLTVGKLAKDMGIPYATLDRWCKTERWRKVPLGTMVEAANLAADNYKMALSELGDEITTEERDAAAAVAREQTAIEMRAQVIDRHRREWAAPRKLLYDAIKAKNFDQAKLAKITAEAMRIVQDSERKAWGLDKPAPQEGLIIELEREREGGSNGDK